MKTLILSLKGSSPGRLLRSSFHLMEDFLSPLLDLGIRLWMANVFWTSGLAKIQSWATTLSLFEHEYKLPFLNDKLAAWGTTLIELACPVLLALGLATRLATIPMLVMTVFLQFTPLSHTDHIYWAFLLGSLLLKGPGKISLDAFLFEKYGGEGKGFTHSFSDSGRSFQGSGEP